MAFKMKGSPMHRNFGIGSPAKHKMDDWGFTHDNKNHRGTTGAGKTAPGHGAAAKMKKDEKTSMYMKSALKQTEYTPPKPTKSEGKHAFTGTPEDKIDEQINMLEERIQMLEEEIDVQRKPASAQQTKDLASLRSQLAALKAGN